MTDFDHFNEVLDKILVPRVVGTEGHKSVKKFIMDDMKKLNWNVEVDEFVEDTPIFKNLTFSNIIATLNPKAERFLVLACHYDSKYFKDHDFLGATDSAVPCAMMINLAHILREQLKTVQDKTEVSLQFIFFDGEEAFKTWSDTDSIYGARHLASKWHEEKSLHKIDMLVLLDLLGAPDPMFYNFFDDTMKWYVQLIKAEERLDSQSLMLRYQSSGTTSKNPRRFFQQLSYNGEIQDDHIPFMKRGVPILHLIPVPFPEIWHKKEDDRSSIDLSTVENLNKILRVFVCEYLHINV